MILTLADRPILDDKGELDEGEGDEVLENILAVSSRVGGDGWMRGGRVGCR